MRNHINIVGYLYIGLGILYLVIGAFVFLILAGSGAVSGDREAFFITGAVGSFVAFIMFVLGLPDIIGGWGLLKRREWARVLVIVMSILNLLSFPIGTAVGGYALYVLFQDDVKAEFQH